MHSLTQSISLRGATGEPLPTPYKGLSALEVEFRRGEFSLVVAGPGTGKSLFALNLATAGNFPVLYFSADSTAATQLTRSTAIITGADVREVKKALLSDAFDPYRDELAERWWLRFNFNARPTAGRVELETDAYIEAFGTFPHLIVVDNITNVDAGGFGDAESYTFGLEELCEWLSEMARLTQAHVLALHHVVGEHSDGINPIPLSGVKGKIHRVPSLILTIFREIDGMDGRILHLSPVKNREGFEDSSGQTYASVDFNKINMRLTDISAVA